MKPLYICLAIIIIIAVIIYLNRGEHYKEIQFPQIYPNAIDDQNFPPSIQGCTESCKKYNTGIIHTAECMNNCMLFSGYIPRMSMIPNVDELVLNL